MTDVTVKESLIQGQGLYAVRPFRKGETILLWSPTYLMQDEIKDLPDQDKHYIDYIDGQPVMMGEPERYVNHCCTPNSVAGDLCDIAVRDIPIGEEITTDYANSYIHQGELKCQCGSSTCRGTITGKKPPA